VYEEYQQDDEIDFPQVKVESSSSLLKFTKLPEDQMVSEGANVEFHCRVALTYHHKIIWMKDGEKIVARDRFYIHSNGDLIISSAIVADEGFYICVITDGIEEKYAQAQLVVNGTCLFRENM
jgi:hypothetical protein